MIQKEIDEFKGINSEYNYYLYTDDDIDNFVNTYYQGEISECYNKLNIIVAKVDFWRYLVLYKYGGVYLDMDSKITKPLNLLIKNEDNAIITMEGNPNLCVQWGLIFSKQHPILKKTIELIVYNIKNNCYPNDIHKMTGPTVYTKAICDVHRELFNENINFKEINKTTDITYKSNEISYRLYGKDYNEYFLYKHPLTYLLYKNKKDWRQEQKEKNLLRDIKS